MKYTNGSYPTRINAYMLGYYHALQSHGLLLNDVPLWELDPGYKAALAKKGDLETLHMCQGNANILDRLKVKELLEENIELTEALCAYRRLLFDHFKYVDNTQFAED